MSAMRCSKCELLVDTDMQDYDFELELCGSCLAHLIEKTIELIACTARRLHQKHEKRGQRANGGGRCSTSTSKT